VPILGICLGHQLLALAAGMKTYKAAVRASRREPPVLERATGRVLVTTQNHGFAVEPSEEREATHVSLYDGTVEGLDFPAERAARRSSIPKQARPARRLADHRPFVEELRAAA
jgi:carbamoyl-phosphate synthase small subunit